MRCNGLLRGVIVSSVAASLPVAALSYGPRAEARAPAVGLSASAQANAEPPAPKLSSDLPHLVPEPPDGLTPEGERPWFDTFSWQEFIALNWQAVDGKRSMPLNPNDVGAFQAAFKPRADGIYPTVVWGTWKQAYELFEQGSSTPTPWDSFQAVLPCINPAPTPPKTFLDATVNDLNQSFAVPLIDQSRNYARYEIRINEPEYTKILGNGWYNRTKLTQALQTPGTVVFPMSDDQKFGAIELKAAWKPMTESDDLSRFYIVNALVLDPNTKQATYQKMGLVGFHIAHKTTPFREWVWSTFEHVDNVQVPEGIHPSYNNGTATPATPKGFDYKPPKFTSTLPPSPNPVQVTRVNAVPTTPAGFSTAELNTKFQNLLAGTIWKNYQLITTQWPTQPQTFKLGGQYPTECGSPFPGSDPVAAKNVVANTVIETYDQTPRPLSSCMACHYAAASTDFSYVLILRASVLPAPASQAEFLASGRFEEDRAFLKMLSQPRAAALAAAPLDPADAAIDRLRALLKNR